ncbi:MAG TPA: M23 family metallopeptidase [Bryobacteraceae bacterium]|nr:M23 family metallopeptidase [Bryobacteraceae bacterium]
MRARLVTVFFAGFALGLVFLAVLLRQTGMLRTSKASAAPAASLESQEPREQPQRPDTHRASRSTRPLDPPAEVPHAATETPTDRRLAERRLIIPVRGVQAEQLREDFNEIRGGHRHEAIDIMAPRGTPVLAADEGAVVKLFLSKPGGLTVYQFDGSQTYCYYYAHLDSYAPGLKEGALLQKGDVLGYVGSTGNASPNAPHLHFAIFQLGPEQHWWQGTPIDPYGFLARSQGR